MKIKLILPGKTDEKYLIESTSQYIKRIQHYIQLEIIEIPFKHLKNQKPELYKIAESQAIENQLSTSDFLVLLDEHGKSFGSVEFANWIQGRMNSGLKQLTFAIGGPYGFSEEIKARAQLLISLSQMTFSHQMIRLFFLEQLYRAFTILRNEPYHNS